MIHQCMQNKNQWPQFHNLITFLLHKINELYSFKIQYSYNKYSNHWRQEWNRDRSNHACQKRSGRQKNTLKKDIVRMERTDTFWFLLNINKNIFPFDENRKLSSLISLLGRRSSDIFLLILYFSYIHLRVTALVGKGIWL